MTDLPLLVVLGGRPGTGKTTLARRLAAELHCAYVRIDAIETAVARCGLAQPPVGPVGYVIGHELAAANLNLGTPVVIDAVNPVPEARAGWRGLAAIARLVVLETMIGDDAEHRRRVTARTPDLADQVVPTWDDVLAWEYVPWDDERDGPRVVVDMIDPDHAVTGVLRLLAGPNPS